MEHEGGVPDSEIRRWGGGLEIATQVRKAVQPRYVTAPPLRSDFRRLASASSASAQSPPFRSVHRRGPG